MNDNASIYLPDTDSLEGFSVKKTYSPDNPEQPFKGIWIPRNIWLADLPIQERVMLAEISHLDGKDGCYASNGYFAKLFKLTSGRVSQIISSLHKKKIVDIEYHKRGKQIIKRVVRILKTPCENTKHPYLNNAKDRVYKDRIKKEVKIVPNGTPSPDKQIDNNKPLVNGLHSKITDFAIQQIKKTHPQGSFDSKRKKDIAIMFEKMIRIDGKTKEQIRNVLTWLPDSPEWKDGGSWATVVQSPLKLRKRDGCGILYFDKLLSAMKVKKKETVHQEIRRNQEERMRRHEALGI